MNCELIKICGMREAENIREVEGLQIDLMGFIFWPKSSRYVSQRPAYLTTRCKRVGVFVNEDLEQVRRIADDYALDFVQLHGQESPEYVASLGGIRLIKAFSIATVDDFAQTVAYEGLVDYFLFDTKAQLPGGSGRQFDWSVLSAYHGSTPFLLSGGICPDDAARIKAIRHPRCAGIDLNSRFELSPGLKDINKLKEFVKKIRI